VNGLNKELKLPVNSVTTYANDLILRI